MGIADKVTDRLDDAVAILADYPELGPGRTDLGKGIRFFPVENWIIFYRVEPGWIEIIRILHAARDIAPDLLAE